MTVTEGTELPPLTIEATPTFVVSTALATRDFQDVHHDRDSAVARGSKDIFLNILTDTGLVQRFVSDWAGPEALIRVDQDPARRALLRLRHADVHRPRGRRATGRDVVVSVSGVDSLGEHVAGTVEVTLP